MSENKGTHVAKITAFQLAMITVAFVASIRALPTLAEYGYSGMLFYLLAVLVFLVPLALVSAELASAWPGRGGVFIWVKEALGARWGFLAIWLQFTVNIVFLPAYMSFVAATSAYVFMPSLAANPYYLISVILVVFWAITIASFFGMKTASWLNTYGAFAATIIPMGTILLLGVIWIVSGKPMQIPLTWKSFIPHYQHFRFGDLAFLAGLIFSLAGIEVSGSHAKDVIDVKKNYPRGIFLAAFLITLVGFGSVSIAAVVPQHELSLVAGTLQAFTIFFDAFHLHFLIPVLALLIFTGCIGALSSTVIGPSKGLFGAATNGEIPPFLSKVNSYGMPVNMFLLQAVVATLLTSVFLFMPTVSSSYWLVMAMVTIIYLVVYLLLFISAIVLRFKRADVERHYQVPGGKIGMCLVAGLGFLSTIFVAIFSFFPPTQISISNAFTFELILILGVLFFIGLGFVVYALRRPSWIREDR